MRALSNISEIVRCPESVEIRATIHPVLAAITAIAPACRASR
jgi:hypothetical protein